MTEDRSSPSGPADAQLAGADPLSDLVARFSDALLAKLRHARDKYGYDDKNSWMQTDWESDCAFQALAHLRKGDPRDVAAYCAFAWHHGWSLKPPEIAPSPRAEPALEAAEWSGLTESEHGELMERYPWAITEISKLYAALAAAEARSERWEKDALLEIKRLEDERDSYRARLIEKVICCLGIEKCDGSHDKGECCDLRIGRGPIMLSDEDAANWASIAEQAEARARTAEETRQAMSERLADTLVANARLEQALLEIAQSPPSAAWGIAERALAAPSERGPARPQSEADAEFWQRARDWYRRQFPDECPERQSEGGSEAEER